MPKQLFLAQLVWITCPMLVLMSCRRLALPSVGFLFFFRFLCVFFACSHSHVSDVAAVKAKSLSAKGISINSDSKALAAWNAYYKSNDPTAVGTYPPPRFLQLPVCATCILSSHVYLV